MHLRSVFRQENEFQELTGVKVIHTFHSGLYQAKKSLQACAKCADSRHTAHA